MAASDHSRELEIEHSRALRKLVRAISNSQGNFALILVRCNSASLRDQMVAQLKTLCLFPIREVHLPHTVKTLYTTLQAELGEPPAAVMIFGYEQVVDLEHLLQSANQVREEFRKNFSFPIVIWLSDDTFTKLSRVAPDFKSWAAVSIKFEISQSQLFQELEKSINSVFSALLQMGAGRFQLSEETFYHFIDLESAFHGLGPSTSHALKANLAFLLGREADRKGERPESRRYYEQSTEIWEQAQPTEVTDQIRYSCVLFHLGLWWRQYATQYRAEFETACTYAKNYYQQSIAQFEQANRPDLVANFINALGEVLVCLKDWGTLETYVRRAIQVQQAQPIRLAYSYGLLAELQLQQSAWENAKQHAETALNLNDNLSNSEIDWSWERQHYRGLYQVLLAEAQQNLGQSQAAISNLETAKANNQPEYDPLLYVRILEDLRIIYFEKGEFWTAFEIKQQQRSIEQQYGLRAFVGAGRLQSRHQVMHPGFATTKQTDVTQEIAASGRIQDVNRLVERIGRADHKLTVIYGQSGVGKSSLVQAGLLPVLKQQAIEARDVLPVLLQVYSDWAKNFGIQFSNSLEEIRGLQFPGLLDSMEKFTAQLRKNVDKNLLTVLIFDQFEEFFFAYRDPLQRRPFFEFLRDCLNIPYVKIILSLREDYLHYLLECNRLTQLDPIDNNILDKKILYYLGNFSEEDAISVIQKLSEISRLGWQPDLVRALVEDLAGKLGEVRPIELQVVGAQLQTEQILTLSQYQEQGPKEAFVERFLDEVVQDCGPQNEAFAKIILYLLTDENNTRPLKTRAELETDLQIIPDRLELILRILVKSGLVFLIPGFPTERYQLVHDYLVPFIRQQQSATLVAELEKEREQRKLTEAKLNQALRKQLKTSRRATLTFGVLTVAIGGIAIAATIAGINAYLSSLIMDVTRQQHLDGVLATTQAGIKLKQLLVAIPGIRLKAVANMNQAVAGQTLTEINRLEGHQKSVTKLSFSSNGEFIASASEDRTIKIWKLNGELVNTLQGHQGAIRSISFSGDGKLIASASDDRMVRVWRVNGQSNPIKELLQPAISVSFRPDGKMLAIASTNQIIKLWDLAGKPKELGRHVGQLTSVSFSPNGRLLASSDDNDTVKIWDVNQGRPKNTTISNYGTISIQFSKNSRILILSNRDQTTKYYNLNGTLIKKIGDSLEEVATLVSFSSDGQKVAAVSRDFPKVLTLNDAERQYPSPSGSHRDLITALSFSPDNKIIASASQDASIRLWNVETFSPYSNQLTKTIKFSPDGSILAVANFDRTIQLRDRNETLLHTFSADGSILQFSPDSKLIAAGSAEDIVTLKTTAGRKSVLRGHLKGIVSMDLSPDGQTLIAAGRDQTLKFWRNDGMQIKTQSIPNLEIQRIQFSPDSNIVVTTTKQNQAKLWHRDGSEIATLAGRTTFLSQVEFSPDSQLIATAGDDNLVNLWRSSDGRPIAVLEGAPELIQSIQFSPNSQLIAAISGSDLNGLSPRRVIKLWTKEGKLLPSSIDTYGTQEILFSPDSQTIACRNRGKIVQLWGINGILKATLSHGGEVKDFSFSPSGDLLATASADERVQLWDQTGQQIGKPLKHSGSVQRVSFSPDDQLIVSASANGEVKLWNRKGDLVKILQNAEEEDSYKNIQIRFSKDSQRIIFEQTVYSLGEYTLKIWSREGQELKPLWAKLSANSEWGTAVSADGQLTAIVEPDKALTLWNSQSNQLAVLRNHRGKIYDVKFSPDGKLLASSSEDQTVNLWDRNGKLLKSLPTKGAVKSISFSPDRKLFASASEQQISLWNLEGNLLASYTSADPIQKIGYSSDGKILAAAIQNQLLLFNAEKLHQKLHTNLSSHPLVLAINSIDPWLNPIRHQDQVTNFQFSSDSKMIVTIAKDGMVHLWHLSSGKSLIPAVRGSQDSYLDNSEIAKFSPDNKLLAVYTDEAIKIQLLNKIWIPNIDLPSFGRAFEFSPNSQSVITAYTNSDSQVPAYTSVTKFFNLNLDLDKQLLQNCQAMRDYLTYNQKLSEKDRYLCARPLR